MQVTSITAAAGSAGEASSMSLSDRMTHAIADSYVGSGQELAMIEAASNDPMVANNPVQLFALQTALADYSKRMVVTAGLANHATKTVETLLKS